MILNTNEGDSIIGEMCGKTYLICVRGDDYASSFTLTLDELVDFCGQMQKELIDAATNA